MGRQSPFRLHLGAAFVDSLFADDRRHGAPEPSNPGSSARRVRPPKVPPMTVLSIGLLYGAVTLLVMFAGVPIAFALGATATLFMIMFMPGGSVDTITQN